MEYNEFNQPIGEKVDAFQVPIFPNALSIEGRYCRLEKLKPKHGEGLYAHFGTVEDLPNWTYLPDEQPQDLEAFQVYLNKKVETKDPYFFAIIDKQTEQAVGIIALLRIDQSNGSIEVGHIHYANILKRTRIATEVQFLLARYVFETLGYRRYEWKCDALNKPSIKAAKRLGFKYEGVFRNHKVYKARNRDTCWLSIIDREWPIYKQQYEKWLDEKNFDELGNQIHRLSI
ncbi:GNAT family N-acetyltransferase [Staphylococcus xylosus]|uniref:GNAT family N-acetyltransferase n=1 Tax=Staphylococcus xylosus TaxID=1288 RepID=UPI0004F5EE48|nr:GNAT family protein [Staphylococcus xylosus]MBG3873471.1 N-acetyltransferase [Staphylococcus xylosus]MBM6637673.1 GNAT family N-acetyltransferase [Staphylococcus xylosus]MCA2500593.1 GNAT family N-acetyltransferase [Staphylococcus xylosus]MCA2502069.1 GNAT family N-acetyltransferase [Staphylococcus xylosus]MCE7780306.1 GNAT family N-acetyltransferase [Staphylococcus xylosus]